MARVEWWEQQATFPRKADREKDLPQLLVSMAFAGCVVGVFACVIWPGRPQEVTREKPSIAITRVFAKGGGPDVLGVLEGEVHGADEKNPRDGADVGSEEEIVGNTPFPETVTSMPSDVVVSNSITLKYER